MWIRAEDNRMIRTDHITEIGGNMFAVYAICYGEEHVLYSNEEDKDAMIYYNALVRELNKREGIHEVMPRSGLLEEVFPHDRMKRLGINETVSELIGKGFSSIEDIVSHDVPDIRLLTGASDEELIAFIEEINKWREFTFDKPWEIKALENLKKQLKGENDNE